MHDIFLFLHIAKFNIGIFLRKTEDVFLQEKMHTDIKQYYKNFLIQDKPQHIHYAIEFIKKKKYPTIIKDNVFYINFFSDDKKRKITCLYDVGLMHFQLLLREALHTLLEKHGGFMLHASANNMDGKAVFFPAKQGSGKSTVMSLLHDKYPALADDTVIIKKENGKFFLYQTPFVETNDWVVKNSTRYPIETVFFLRKSNMYVIKKSTDNIYIIDRLTKQLRFYKENSNSQVKYLIEFAGSCKFYHLSFGKDKNKLIELFQNSF